jgi:hypothetical protein
MIDMTVTESLPSPDLALRAIAVAATRPIDALRALESTDSLEGRRLFLELLRILRGEEPLRRMSRDLRDALPRLVAVTCTAA